MEKHNIVSGAPSAQHHAPEFFRLPAKGPDPFFGLTRSYYYQLEQAGSIKLVRVRNRGCLRGVTLIPYDKVSAFIRSLADSTKETAA